MDMAVGIIIGGAFTSIVSSLVEDIITPILGLFGGMNFDKLSWNILGEVTLNYGKFLTAIINFLIMAFGCLCDRQNDQHRFRQARRFRKEAGRSQDNQDLSDMQSRNFH